MIRSSKSRVLTAIAFLVFSPTPSWSADTIDEIVVTADFRGRTLRDVPASITILGSEEIESRAVQHFEELINSIPNVNWSGDGHRARYFQIRGVGELEQYQGAPNPSVGLLIDDIDFSGIGTIATLFDMQQIEVLRGPQGTRYGANALAGLIYMRSAAPTAEFDGRLEVSAGDDGMLSAGVAVGGGLNDDDSVLGRLSIHHHESNGFRDNTFLNRDDTNGRDEITVRGRLYWEGGDDLHFNLAAIYADVNDGYDAFALDNSYTMLSDKPGKDAQKSVGSSLRIEYNGFADTTLTSITSFADSNIKFSYDADWGNSESWAPVTYDYVSSSDRQRQTLSQEIRLTADSWLFGLYAMQLDDEIATSNRGDYYDPFYDFADSLDATYGSDYKATNIAAFTQYDHEVTQASRLSVGFRAERRSTDYIDTDGLDSGPSESMWGGELTFNHDHSDAVTSFVSLSKGYKAGGFNIGFVPAERRIFDAEELVNLELGVKSSLRDNTLSVNASFFVSRMRDQQVRTSFQIDPGDPTSFVFFTDNAAKGKMLGFEADLRWIPNDAWVVYANVGLLKTEFEDFQTPQVDLTGRALAHAPDYTLAFGASYDYANGFFTGVDISARDAFYFDLSHDQKSASYELVNARVGYNSNTWTAALWVRNLLDEAYAVRGFYFGNEPPDFPNALYTRSGDPRHFGITFDKRF
jgi:outer membrane receptor protein involved in Fe transport